MIFFTFNNKLYLINENKLINYDDNKNYNKPKYRVRIMDVGVENNYRRLEKLYIIN